MSQYFMLVLERIHSMGSLDKDNNFYYLRRLILPIADKY